MSEQSTDPGQTRDESSSQRGEAAPEAASPFTDEEAEQADREGRHVADDVEDNAGSTGSPWRDRPSGRSGTSTGDVRRGQALDAR